MKCKKNIIQSFVQLKFDFDIQVSLDVDFSPTYETHAKPFSADFIHIEVSDEDVKKIDEFVKLVIIKKKSESHHQNDKGSHYKRYYTGILGEVAMEKFFGITGIVDWSVGDSEKYYVPDLRNIGLEVGIKTAYYGAFPIVFKKNFLNEIILIRWKDRHIYICGLATVNVLNKYQSDELILDDNLRKRGTKTGFYGFSYLKKFSSLNELKQLLENEKSKPNDVGLGESTR
jgi:hypothetical protein